MAHFFLVKKSAASLAGPVNELVRKGHTVHALTRGTSNKEGLSHERIKLVTGDITDRASLKRGMAGCSQVYHLAAYAKNWAPNKQVFFDQNVDGMVDVFEAAKESDIERGRKLGAVDYLVKSDVSLTDLVAKVKQYIKETSMRTIKIISLKAAK